jgi:serine/threonine protein kinase
LTVQENWIRKENIGKGSYGTVYRACCEDNCSFVMKQLRKRNFDKKQFIKEIKMQSALLLAPRKITPTIHYVDEQRRIIVMDALNQDFWTYWRKKY